MTGHKTGPGKSGLGPAGVARRRESAVQVRAADDPLNFFRRHDAYDSQTTWGRPNDLTAACRRAADSLQVGDNNDVVGTRIALLERTGDQDDAVSHGAVGRPSRQCAGRFRRQSGLRDLIGQHTGWERDSNQIPDPCVHEPGERALVVVAGVPIDVARTCALRRGVGRLPHPYCCVPFRGGAVWWVDRLAAGDTDRTDIGQDRAGTRGDGKGERNRLGGQRNPWIGLDL
jgi:hypothetical protein